MKAVYALYRNPGTAQRAFDNLRKAGIADRDIQILSSEPLEEYEFGQRDRETWMTWIAEILRRILSSTCGSVNVRALKVPFLT